MNIIKRLAIKLRFQVWAPLRANTGFDSFYNSHAQFGEDMVLRYLVNGINQGFYVDLGAHHPVFLSNTYHFYRRGWHGLCVDADPRSMELFQVLRPRDLNVNACLGPIQGQEAVFHIFDEAALNTLDVVEAEKIIRSGRARLLQKRIIATHTLTSLLDTYLPKGMQIDLLSIDIEGIDEMLILAQDWSLLHPRVIVFESQGVGWQQVGELPSVRHLEKFGYAVEAKCGHSVVMATQLR